MSFRFHRQGNEIKISGQINEFVDLEPIFDNSWKRLYFDLSGIKEVNSIGLRTWADFTKKFKGFIVYRQCSVPMMEQLNMVPEALGNKAWVESFYAPFFCPECFKETQIVLELGKSFDPKAKEITSEVNCPSCNQVMEPEFHRDEYFQFVDDLKPEIEELLNNEEEAEEENQQKDETPKKVIQPRKPFRSKILIFPPGDPDNPVIAMTENISVGGIFISTFMEYNIGDRFKVQFRIPWSSDLHEIEADVQVKWLRDHRLDSNILPGIGLEFVDINDKEKRAIEGYIEDFLK